MTRRSSSDYAHLALGEGAAGYFTIDKRRRRWLDDPMVVMLLNGMPWRVMLLNGITRRYVTMWRLVRMERL